MNKIMCWVINESLRCGCWCLCLEGSVSNDLTAQAEKKRHIRFFFYQAETPRLAVSAKDNCLSGVIVSTAEEKQTWGLLKTF